MYITNRELDLSNKKLIVDYINNIKKYSKEEAIEAIENYKRITNEEEKIKMRNEIEEKK